MYRVIYYDSLGLVTDKSFESEADALEFVRVTSPDYYRIVNYTDSRTITDVTPAPII